jgi:hypothetical protein
MFDESFWVCDQRLIARPKPGVTASQRITPPSAGRDTLQIKSGANFERTAFALGHHDETPSRGTCKRKLKKERVSDGWGFLSDTV